MSQYTVERRFMSKYGWRWCVIRLDDEVIICHYKLHLDACVDVWQRNKPEEVAA